jgi:hypothetical protein
MIRALLAGTKTQTRRIVKPKWTIYPASDPRMTKWSPANPYGQPGDKLYVRENAWQRPERTQKMMREGADTWPPFIYDADYPAGIPWEERDNLKTWGWKRRPSIHLPRKGSRILLEITAVRVERLHEISEADARAEGVIEGAGDFAGCFSVPGTQAMSGTTAKECYARLWDEINGAGSWAANPFCWVIEFRRLA